MSRNKTQYVIYRDHGFFNNPNEKEGLEILEIANTKNKAFQKMKKVNGDSIFRIHITPSKYFTEFVLVKRCWPFEEKKEEFFIIEEESN